MNHKQATRSTGNRGRRLGAVAGTAAALTLLAACGSSSSSTTPGTQPANTGKAISGGTLTISSPTPPISLNPAINGNGVPLMWFDSLAYEPLVFRTANNTTTPGLATSWKYAAGNRSLTIQLRPGVKFSDGTPLTAEAVVKYIEYYQKSGQFAFNLANLSSVKATGPLTVTFNLSHPDPLYLYYLDEEGVVGDIASPAALANPTEMNSETYGAGEYMLDKAATVPNSSYVYVRNPYYYDPSAVHFKKVIVTIIADNNAALAAVQSGQVQVALGDATTAAAAKSDGVDVTSALGSMDGVVIADRDGKVAAPFGNVKVRQALNYAIDRTGLVKTVYGAYGTPTDQYKSAGTDGYVAGLANAYPYNPTKAKQLLAQAGYPKGFSFKLIQQPGVPGGSLLAQAMVQEWAAIGVKAALTVPTTFSDYVAKIETGQYGATTYTYEYQPYIWESNELFAPTGTYNFFKVQNPAVNAVSAKVDTQALGTSAANTLEQQDMTVAVQQALSVPVAAADTLMYSAKDIGGIAYTPSYPIPVPTEWYVTG